jgi:hypothetical protein
MSPPVPNSTNQTPESSPKTSESDAAEAVPEQPTQATVLPPRRVASVPSEAASEADRIGLRIESQFLRTQSPSLSQRIEVQELAGSVTRLEQMTPSPEKIPRQVKFVQLPVREEGAISSSDVGSQWGLEKRRSVSWLVIAGASVVAIVVLCVFLLPLVNSSYRKKARLARLAKPVTTAVAPVAKEKIPPEIANPLTGKQAEAMQLFRTYATATTLEEILPYLRDSETLAPILRDRWQAMGISKQWQPATECSWLIVPQESRSYAVLCGVLPDQSNFTAYFVNEGGKLLLDWKATTTYGTATFAELEKKQGDPTEVRGKISFSDYYNATWPEKVYQCFKFTSADKESTIWCYAKRGESANVSLFKLLFGDDKNGVTELKVNRITLRLARGPDTSLPNQWLVQEMLNPDWITP